MFENEVHDGILFGPVSAERTQVPVPLLRLRDTRRLSVSSCVLSEESRARQSLPRYQT